MQHTFYSNIECFDNKSEKKKLYSTKNTHFFFTSPITREIKDRQPLIRGIGAYNGGKYI